MKAHKISQKQFAEYINVLVSTFYSWQRYGRSVEVGTAYDIARALGVSIEYLVTGVDGKSAEERMERLETRKTAEEEMKKLVGKLQEEMGKL